MDDMALNKKIDDRALKLIKENDSFTSRKVTDNPNDALEMVNRRYVTLNGTIRPTGSVMGQQFIDMSLASGRGKPIYWNGIGWIDATGAYV